MEYINIFDHSIHTNKCFEIVWLRDLVNVKMVQLFWYIHEDKQHMPKEKS